MHAGSDHGWRGVYRSVVTEELIKDGHEVVVYDNLSKGHRGAVVPGAVFVEGDLRELGWQPQFQDLGVIIESAWKWMQAHSEGY